MTDLQTPEDRRLAERIRRSMAHYRFDRPLPAEPRRRPTAALRLGGLVAASLAGAVATLVVIGLLGGLPARPPAGEGPSPTPGAASETPATPSPSPSSVAWQVEDADALAACRPLDPSGVLDEWRRAGESRAEVAARFGDLPLLIVDRRPEAAVFVFGDDRFVIGCRFVPTQPGPETIMRGRRAVEPGPVRPLFVTSDPHVVDAEGQPVPGSHPDTLAVGVAAPDVARVAVLLEDGSTLDARIAGGLWLAWWQVPLAGTAIRAYDAEGGLLGEVEHRFDIIELPADGVTIGPAESEAPSATDG